MKKILLFALLLSPLVALGQPVPATTPYTRTWLRSVNQSNSLYNLGIASTNQTTFTNVLNLTNTVNLTNSTTVTNIDGTTITTNASGALTLKVGGALPAMNAAALTNLPRDMHMLYVSPDGNDDTAVRGDPTRPWLTTYGVTNYDTYNSTYPESNTFGACIEATNGDTIVMLPGNHTQGAIPLRDGVNLKGVGFPFIRRVPLSVNGSGAPFSVDIPAAGLMPFIVPGNNSVIEGVKVLCETNQFDSCIGFATLQDATVFAGAFAGAITNRNSDNVTVRDCEFWGGTDVIYMVGNGSNSVRWTISGCYLHSDWDTFRLDCSGWTNMTVQSVNNILRPVAYVGNSSTLQGRGYVVSGTTALQDINSVIYLYGDPTNSFACWLETKAVADFTGTKWYGTNGLGGLTNDGTCVVSGMLINGLSNGAAIFPAAITGNLSGGTNLPVAGIAATGIGATKYLKGDGTWDTPAGSGDAVLAANQTFSGTNTFLIGTKLGVPFSMIDTNVASLGTNTWTHDGIYDGWQFDGNIRMVDLSVTADAAITGTLTVGAIDDSARILNAVNGKGLQFEWNQASTRWDVKSNALHGTFTGGGGALTNQYGISMDGMPGLDVTNTLTRDLTVSNLNVKGTFTVANGNATTTVSNLNVTGNLIGTGTSNYLGTLDAGQVTITLPITNDLHFASAGGTPTNLTLAAAGNISALNFKTPARAPSVGQILAATNINGSCDWSNMPAAGAGLDILSSTVDVIHEGWSGGSGSSLSVGELGWYYKIFGTASFNNTVVAVANHPGVQTFTTGTAANDGAVAVLGGVTNQVGGVVPPLSAATGWTNTWIFKLSVTNDVVVWMGLVNNLVYFTTEPASWIGLHVDSANTNTFTYKCVSNSVPTAATGPALDNNWHRFTIWSTDAGTISFSVDGANVQTINSNVPTTAFSPMVLIKKSSTANAVTLSLDDMKMIMVGLSR